MTNDSHINVTKGVCTSYVGSDAVHLLRAKMLRSSIKLHLATGMIPTRGVTITKMFKMAGEYTGQTYKRGQHERAMQDLTVWIETMTSALPVNHN